MTPLGRSVERAAHTCAHSLALCARAEEVACAALAVHNPYGQADWDTVRWMHLLDRLARSHTRAQLIRARLEAAHLPEALGDGLSSAGQAGGVSQSPRQRRNGPDTEVSWHRTGTEVP